MNVYDSARMADLLAPLGYRSVDDPAGADMVILNTCHIREKAAEKVYSDLGRLRLDKQAAARDGRRMVLVVAGCVAQAEGAEILRRAPHVDLVVGPQTYARLPDLLDRVGRTAGERVATEFPVMPKFDLLPEPRADGPSAFLSVQEGCDRFCAFCVVPYTRGAEYSRPAAEVMADARALLAQGVREITLVGQNVNAYHGAPGGLGDLLRELASLDGMDRLRYTTSHPADMDDGLIAAHREVPQLMPFLHLPAQSGSDRVLRAMNRRHTADDYRRLVDRLRAARPDLALSSDFITGFPGETEAEFQATLDLVAEIGFAQAYSFKFSARPGTPAATLPDQVADAVAGERLSRLQDRLNADQEAFNRACVGRVLPVLLDRAGRHPGQLVGRSPHMQAVHVAAGAARPGDLVDLKIVAAHPNSLAGVAVAAPARACA